MRSDNTSATGKTFSNTTTSRPSHEETSSSLTKPSVPLRRDSTELPTTNNQTGIEKNSETYFSERNKKKQLFRKIYKYDGKDNKFISNLKIRKSKTNEVGASSRKWEQYAFTNGEKSDREIIFEPNKTSTLQLLKEKDQDSMDDNYRTSISASSSSLTGGSEEKCRNNDEHLEESSIPNLTRIDKSDRQLTLKLPPDEKAFAETPHRLVHPRDIETEGERESPDESTRGLELENNPNDWRSQPGAFAIKGIAEGERPAWAQRSRLLSFGASIRSLLSRQSSLSPETPEENQGTMEQPKAGQVITADVEKINKEENTKNKRNSLFKKVKWVAVVAAIIIVITVLLGVGLSALSGSNHNETSENDSNGTKNDDCNYSTFEGVSVPWKKCLCNESFPNMDESYTLQYNIVKADLTAEAMLTSDFNHTITSCEPINMALHWLTKDTIEHGSYPQNRIISRFVLALCYVSWNENNPSQWKNNEGWMTYLPECDWFGISCNEDEEIVKISITYDRLSGSIPTEISFLKRLEELDLESNKIRGTVPSEVGLLTDLTSVSMHKNEVQGTLPTEIGNLSNLQDMQFSANFLNGTIPTEIGNMQKLERIEFVSNIENFGMNQLSGSIPTSIGLCTSLKSINFQENALSDNIPTEIGHLEKLENLKLDNAGFTGTLPSEIGLLSDLKVLSCPSNKFVGSIPSYFQHLQNLKDLNLMKNKFTGTIPSTIGLYTSLCFIYFSDNFVTGTIPSEIGLLSSSLEGLDLSGNQLSGRIPTQLAKCTGLISMNLSGNHGLDGTIPSELGHLTNLEKFFFIETMLGGSVPSEICALRNSKLNTLSGDCPNTIECDFPDCCTDCNSFIT